MKKFVFTLATALLLAGFSATAQDDSSKNKAAADAGTSSEQIRKDKDEQKRQLEVQREKLDDESRDMQDRKRDMEVQVRRAKEQVMDAQRKLNDYDEIVIKRKNADKNEKVTIEIKDDKVTVNGKPIEDFANDDVSVMLRSPRRFVLTGPKTPFRNGNSFWQAEGGDGKDHALLGVLSSSSDNAAIAKVSDGSAADKAGLKKDDIITRVDDHNVANFKELTEAIDRYQPGDKVTIAYKRNGKEKQTIATLGKRPGIQNVRVYSDDDGDMSEGFAPLAELGEIPPIPPVPPVPPIPPSPNFNFDFDGTFDGASAFNGQPRLGIQAQDTEDGKGVKVLGVDGGSAAEKAGLKVDDIITSFDGKTVNSADELRHASNDSKTKSTVKVQLKRNGKTQDVELKVPKKLKTATL